MSHGNELPKVIDKSQADIDAAIAAIKASDMQSSTKDFAVSCIRLAIWLPNALLEHKIKLSNLRKLIFGLGKKNKEKSKQNQNTEEETTPKTECNNDAKPDESIAPPASKNVTQQLQSHGHGRLSHSAYTNTIDHQLHCNLKPDDLCPTRCGGKLYYFEPGILVRVKGQNLAAVHKYWIEKLRCSLCGELISADIPQYVGTEKYDAAFKAILVL